MLILVALQQRVGIWKLEVLKLQHSFGPPAHDSLYKLIQDLHKNVTHHAVLPFSDAMHLCITLLHKTPQDMQLQQNCNVQELTYVACIRV